MDSSLSAWLVVLTPILAAAIQSGTPILYATLGELVMERAGIINLGVEGMMMMGAFSAFLGLYLTGNPWFGFFCGGFAAMLMSALHGTVCMIFLGSQVVSGLALTIFGVGLANYLGTPFVGTSTDGFTQSAIPYLSEIPLLGKVLFNQDPLVYVSYFLPVLLWFLFMRTNYGLSLRAVGEKPVAVRTAGKSPKKLRWSAILLGGFLVGLGGAYFSLSYVHMWTDDIVKGRGWIAVALVIFAFWRPGRAVWGAYLFGGVMAFQLRVQAMGIELPSSVLHAMPYILTLLVLLVSARRGQVSNAPAALGVNLEPGE